MTGHKNETGKRNGSPPSLSGLDVGSGRVSPEARPERPGKYADNPREAGAGDTDGAPGNQG